jgi:adenine-specific DNA methylase
MPKRAIEESFPIVEINRLAVPERNSFKPIYMMHKWFARRASCVFRGILLGALKPAGTDIMAEFYKDHRADPDTQGKVIIDPFMGGGTTVVEALRLGCKVVGIDLNPVAWFVVKTQVEPVDLPSLDAAFARLVNRHVAWSGKPLRETLLDLYRTEAPWTLPAADTPALGASDVIYTYWVKSAPCTSPTCKKTVPLFGDYVVAGKSPTVRYHPDCTCPRCHKQFDWEIEPAALVADPRLMVHAATYSGGAGRATALDLRSSRRRPLCCSRSIGRRSGCCTVGASSSRSCILSQLHRSRAPKFHPRAGGRAEQDSKAETEESPAHRPALSKHRGGVPVARRTRRGRPRAQPRWSRVRTLHRQSTRHRAICVFSLRK